MKLIKLILKPILVLAVLVTIPLWIIPAMFLCFVYDWLPR